LKAAGGPMLRKLIGRSTRSYHPEGEAHNFRDAYN
jgi:hypothetical protein